MTNSEAQAQKPITSPNCAGYLRKWNQAIKNCCCTWPKRSPETSSNPFHPGSLKRSGRRRDRLPFKEVSLLLQNDSARVCDFSCIRHVELHHNLTAEIFRNPDDHLPNLWVCV